MQGNSKENNNKESSKFAYLPGNGTKFVKPSTETNVSWGSSAKPLRRARPPSNFLVGADSHAVVRCCHGHHQSKLLHDHKGEGNEKKSREKHEHGELKINRKRSNKTRVSGREATSINTRKKEGYSLFQFPQ